MFSHISMNWRGKPLTSRELIVELMGHTTTEKGLKKDLDLAKKIDKAIIPGIQGGPHFNNIAGIGVALKEASTKQFKKYAEQVLKNAQILAKELKKYNFKLVTG